MKFAVVISFLVIVATTKSEIYEPNMEGDALSGNAVTIPASLIVPRPPNIAYGSSETVPTPEDGVPDVIMYLSPNPLPNQQYLTDNSASSQQYLAYNSLPSQQYFTGSSVSDQQYLTGIPMHSQNYLMGIPMHNPKYLTLRSPPNHQYFRRY